MEDTTYTVSTPLETDSGKVIWHKVGTYFRNDDKYKNYVGVIHLNSIPIGAVSPLKLFVYPRQGKKQEPDNHNKSNYRNPDKFDDDIPY